jgi:hypothetical protein
MGTSKKSQPEGVSAVKRDCSTFEWRNGNSSIFVLGKYRQQFSGVNTTKSAKSTEQSNKVHLQVAQNEYKTALSKPSDIAYFKRTREASGES